jgi:ribosomal protein S18 acetylase RimI-like enzyme/predicted double-glycine peptidase
MPAPVIRLSSVRDLDALERLENLCFQADRFTRDQIEYLLSRAHATVLVLEHRKTIAGAAYMLWREARLAGRLYNIAVHPSLQGKGLASLLLRECEAEALRRECAGINLEVRIDNPRAIAFYEKHGYARQKVFTDYYSDGAAALRMVKTLPSVIPAPLRYEIPYYAQTMDFTCGPAAVMMAVKYFRPETHLTRSLELAMWKEATLVFMTSGVGGTDPFGLALAARRRGLHARVISSSENVPFVRSVRTKRKREVIRLLHEDMKNQAVRAGIGNGSYRVTPADLAGALHRNMVPITLVSTYRLTGGKAPHWVVVTGLNKNNIYVHDPDLESYGGKGKRARNIAISREEFQRMSRYGKNLYSCTILLGPADAVELPNGNAAR